MSAYVRHAAEARMPTEFGVFRIHAYETENPARPYAALVMGTVKNAYSVLARVHSACLTGDTFSSLKCDCGPQLKKAQRMVVDAGQGIIVYADDHEGRGKGLISKIRAYEKQDQGLDTIEADHAIGEEIEARDYAIAASVLADLGVASVRLMTNNPAKVEALTDAGIVVTGTIPIVIAYNPENRLYLETKRLQMGHTGVGLT